jgi:hypothetical protein
VRDRETTKISQDPQTNKQKKVSTQTALRVAGPRAAVAKVAAGVGERVLGEREAERVGLKERVRDDVRVGARVLGRAAEVAAGAAATLDAEASRGVALGLGLAHAALALEARAAVLARGAGGLRVRGRQPGGGRGVAVCWFDGRLGAFRFDFFFCCERVLFFFLVSFFSSSVFSTHPPPPLLLLLLLLLLLPPPLEQQ